MIRKAVLLGRAFYY